MARKKERKNQYNGRAQPEIRARGLVWFITGVLTGGVAVAILLTAPSWFSQWPTLKVPQLAEPLADIIASEPKLTKPTFDFYKVLPDMEVTVPKPPPVSKTPQITTPKSQAASKYILQIASFQRYSDADQLKAQLTLGGFNVQIKTIKLNGKTWHRVRSGPYHNLANAINQQQRLEQQHLHSILLKMHS